MEGQRVDHSPQGRKKPLIIGGVALAVVLCAYLGLCAWVGSMDTIFPNVFVLGVDVSGLTEEEAQAAVDRELDVWGDQVTATLCYNGWRGGVTAAQLRDQWTEAAEPAIRVGRGNFLTQGGWYLAHLMGTTHMVQIPRSPENPMLEQLLDRMEREVNGNVTQASYEVNGDHLVMTKGRTGVVIDRNEARKAALDAMDEALRLKFSKEIEEDAEVEVERELNSSETAPEEPDFNAIHQALYAQAKSSEMDPETRQLTDHVVGVDFDPAALKAAYEKAAEGETFAIPLDVTQPAETRESLEAKLFRDLLGQGTTTVGGSANRKTNVKLSAEACNGMILLPGEEFSYNNTTGSRTADKGYLPAPIYVGGKSEDDIGGGICQTSSTIYFAVLHTDLEVVERHDHQFNTGYVTQGMDATVFFGSLDFRFKNSTEYPIKLVTESYDQGGKRKLTVKIYGTNEAGVYAVPKSDVFDYVTPTNKYQPDSSVPQGTLVLDKEQYAYTGMSAQTYRYIYAKDGTLLEKQDMGLSKYKMRPHLYHYNPLDGDPASWPDGVPPKPVEPVTPEPPVEPVTPEPPVEPVQPEQPEVPDQPEPPVQPAQPETPEESGQTT